MSRSRASPGTPPGLGGGEAHRAGRRRPEDGAVSLWPRRLRCPGAGETVAVLLLPGFGPTLILDRLQQVEHEAYLTFMAGRAGLQVPEVLAVGRFGPRRDAALITRLPDGPALSEADEDSSVRRNSRRAAPGRGRSCSLSFRWSRRPGLSPVPSRASCPWAVRPGDVEHLHRARRRRRRGVRRPGQVLPAPGLRLGDGGRLGAIASAASWAARGCSSSFPSASPPGASTRR